MRVVLPCAVILGGIVGCSAFVSLDGLRVIEGGAPDATLVDVATDATNDGDAVTTNPDSGPSCPQGLEGPVLASVPGAGYCIDSTEVTADQYQKFVDAKVDPSGQNALCNWNSNFDPGVGNTGAMPVVAIDWCDAFAYCKWAGKRLCGAVGGGSIAFADYANAMSSQWFRACSATGTRTYPYGSTYDPVTCNGIDREAGVLPVASVATCVGGYPGIYDLAGNAGEWIDSCEDGSGANGPWEDRCRTCGGTAVYSDPGSQWTRCDIDDWNPRSSQYYDRGFRCCSAP